MSSKTRTRTTSATCTTGSTRSRALRPVPDQATVTKVRTDAEDKLWEALHANPNSTAADLAGAATIGKSTAQKILVKWAGEGSVTRTAGIAEGGRRAADLWAITEINADSANTAQADPTTLVAPDTTDDAKPVEGDPTEPTDTAADNAQDTTETGATDPAETGPLVAEVTEPAADGAATDGGGGGKAARLAPGALRGMVEDYLRDHPGEEFGPTAIAKALGGKSSGAVSNALDKLVEDKTVVKTTESPRRFTLAPAEQAAAPAPTS